MKFLNKLFAFSILIALTVACTPVSESSVIEVQVDYSEVNNIQLTSLNRSDNTENCCGGKPIIIKPKI